MLRSYAMKVSELKRIVNELPDDLDIKLDITQGIMWNLKGQEVGEIERDKIQFLYSDTSDVINLTVDRLEIKDNALHIYAGPSSTENLN